MMNSNPPFRPGEREFAIQIRSLLLKCVDLLERQYSLGKYKSSREITISSNDSIGGAVSTPAVVGESIKESVKHGS